MEDQKELTNNPNPEQAEASAKKLTGEDLLKKIKACRDETQDILKRVPGKVAKDESFTNVLSQINNDQEICIKYINLLSSNLSNLKKSEIGNLPEALLATKSRISGELKIVKILKEKNPFKKDNLTTEEIRTKKVEDIYAINAFVSLSRGQEESEWINYENFSAELKVRQEQEKTKAPSEGFNPFSFIVLFFILFVILKRSSWAKNLLTKAVKAVAPADGASGDKKE